jgi:hypothetical protein
MQDGEKGQGDAMYAQDLLAGAIAGVRSRSRDIPLKAPQYIRIYT